MRVVSTVLPDWKPMFDLSHFLQASRDKRVAPPSPLTNSPSPVGPFSKRELSIFPPSPTPTLIRLDATPCAQHALSTSFLSGFWSSINVPCSNLLFPQTTKPTNPRSFGPTACEMRFGFKTQAPPGYLILVFYPAVFFKVLFFPFPGDAACLLPCYLWPLDPTTLPTRRHNFFSSPLLPVFAR